MATGHGLCGLCPAHPPSWETLQRGRRAVSAPEVDAARCKLLVQACPGRLARHGRCPDHAWGATWLLSAKAWLKWKAVPFAVFLIFFTALTLCLTLGWNE